MSSVGKANAFMKVCKDNSWQTKWKASESREWVEVTATRDSEQIVIAWNEDQLMGPPQYTLNGYTRGLHSAAVAKRTVQQLKPALDDFKRAARKASGQLAKATENSTVPVAAPITYSLPFDVETSPDEVILKAVRGNTVVWRNRLTGQLESEFVPHKISDGHGVKVFNWDTERVFYLAEANSGRAYLSFMTTNGVFRAVALETLVGVV